jgi:hypothetical protein
LRGAVDLTAHEGYAFVGEAQSGNSCEAGVSLHLVTFLREHGALTIKYPVETHPPNGLNFSASNRIVFEMV